MPNSNQALRAAAMTAASLDGLRRAGWAKWYHEVEAHALTTRIKMAWMRRAAEMALRVTYHPEIRSDDPLAECARALLGTLRLRPEGQVVLRTLIEQIRQERADAEQAAEAEA